MKTITPCLWFNNEAEAAAGLYTSLFPGSGIGSKTQSTRMMADKSGQSLGPVMMVNFHIGKQPVLGLNGGPLFKPTPAHSFFVQCPTEAEADRLWNVLSEGGMIRMPLDVYPWARKYGWTADRFGFDWQIMVAPEPFSIALGLLFCNKAFGRGQDALDHYEAVFQDYRLDSLVPNESDQTIVQANFAIMGQSFVLTESNGPHEFTFNEAFSLLVPCDTQEEIDYYWRKLGEGGQTSQCGWLKDKFGLSWQIVPSKMSEYMADPKRAARVIEAILLMTKIDLRAVEQAALSD